MKRSKAIMALLCALALLLFSGISASAAATPHLSTSETSALLEYARACLLARLDGIPSPAPPPCATRQRQACFVTFFRDRRVVACFGGFTPRRGTLAEEIDDNIRLALSNDRRSRTLTRETALAADIQITFPQERPEPVSDHRLIDPLREGMFVEANDNGVAFVPGEARTASWAFRQGMARLGVSNRSAVRVSRFRAVAISTRER